jgi:hypothetical protein
MRRCKAGVLLLLVLIGLGVAQTWFQKPSNTSCAWQRYDGAYFPGTKMVYFPCGRVNTTYYSTVYSYNDSSGSYTNTGATMPVGVVNYDASVLRDDYNLSAGDTYGIYIVGGNNAGGIVTNLQVYHPRSNSSADISTDPVPLRSLNNSIVTAIASVSVNGKLYAFGGFNTNYSLSNQCWVYDPTQSAGSRWSQLANLNMARGYIAAAVVDNYIYACGGDTADAANASLYARAYVERFDTDNPSNGWELLTGSPMPRACDEVRAFGFGASSPDGYQNTVIVAGLGQWPNEYDTSYILNTSSGTWNTFSRLNLKRRNMAGELIPAEASATRVPAIWVWGGRYDSDANVRTIPEAIYPLTTVSLTAPAGGEVWLEGETHDITWTSTFSATDSIVYSTNGGTSWSYVAKQSPPSSRDYTWTIPGTPGTNCKVKVYAFNPSCKDSAVSGAFTILGLPNCNLTSPVGGEQWQVGVVHNITWNSAKSATDSVVAFDGSNWYFIDKQTPPSSRSIPWTVPNAPGANWQVSVYALNPPAPQASSQGGRFSIVPAPTAGLTAPNGGEVWQVGVSHDVTWTSTGSAADSVLYTDGSNYYVIGVQRPAGSRTIAWNVPNTPGVNWRVKVCAISPDALAPPATAQSASPFTIVGAPTAAVTSPVGGEYWQVGVDHNVTWNSSNTVADSVVATNGADFTFIGVQRPAGSRSIAWNVSGAPGSAWRVRVFALGADPLAPRCSVQSAGPFSIVDAPTVGSLIPNGGEAWEVGSHHNITWASANSNTDSIVFTRDGVNWTYVGKQSPPSTRRFDWNVPAPPSTTCRVRIFAVCRDPLAPKPNVTSASDFSIVTAPTVAVTAPNGGESWLAGSVQNITWNSTNSNTDSIVWSADNGATWTFVAKQSPPAHTYAWPVPATIGSQNLIGVFAIGLGLTVSDQSNAVFTILSPSGGWLRKTDLPLGPKSKPVKDGGCLAYAAGRRDSSFVYALKGNNTYEFYRYTIADSSWIARESIPAYNRNSKKKGIKKGASLAAVRRKLGGTPPDWSSTIYATKGNNLLDFWQYDPAGGWTQKTDVPIGSKNVKEGTGMVHVKIHFPGPDTDTNYVYFLKGSGTFEFYRYNTEADAWSAALAPVPGGASGKPYKNGSALAYGGGDTIYCLKGSYNEFAAYSITANTWQTRDPLPMIGSSGKKKKVKDGAGLAAAGDFVYALKGGNTNEFYQYNTTDGKWYVLADMPTIVKKVKAGGALVAADAVQALFAFRGSGTREFWSYGPVGLFAAAPAVVNPAKAVQVSSVFGIGQTSLRVAPNPFTAASGVTYSLPRAGNAGLRLYDVTGKLVSVLAQGYAPAGSHFARIDAKALVPGIYLLKFECENYTTTEKLIIE